MAISDKMLDELLGDAKTESDLFGKDGVIKQLSKRLVERVLESEMTHHLGYEKHSVKGNKSGNSRNGKSSKQMLLESGELEISVPRDRNGEFEPQLIEKRRARLSGIEDMVLSLYGKGMTVRNICRHVEEMYDYGISRDLVSTITDGILDEMREWKHRALKRLYPMVFIDGFVVKSRQDKQVMNRTVYVIFGINLCGEKEVLSLSLGETEGAKYWLSVLTELKKKIYSADTVELAAEYLEKFEITWGEKYGAIVNSWRSHWERIIPFFDYPLEIRKVIYTTNIIEFLNRALRKAVKNRGHFPTEDAVMKVLYLAIRGVSKRWRMPIRHWKRR